jgi:protein-S-isoprenylcysteine O-methyltransferase Ste14
MFAAGLLALVAVSIYCLRAAHHEYETAGRLSSTTVAAAWVLHILHAALTGYAAWHAMWAIPIDGTLAFAVGVALIAQGLGLAFAGAIGFGSLDRMLGRVDDRLICTGAYRYSRNPQSVGWTAALLGLSILGRSAAAVGLVALFWIVFRVYVALEERHLERLHGEAYRRYKGVTPRYLGRTRTTDDPL